MGRFEPQVFDTCLRDYAAGRQIIYALSGYKSKYQPPPSFMFFDAKTGALQSLAIMFMSNVEYENSFETADDFYSRVQPWVDDYIATAPEEGGLRDGYFVSNLWFFSVQHALVVGAWLSTLVSATTAAAVLLVMTKDFRVSALAALTIFAIVASECGVLVLLDWKLGPIESIIFSVAVGMSVDFVAHISHAFVHANPDESVSQSDNGIRSWRAKQAQARMGRSISTATVSTAAAGAVMLFSRTVFFFEFGLFMVLVMALSWLFATLYLLPLLSIFGPVQTGAESDSSLSRCLELLKARWRRHFGSFYTWNDQTQHSDQPKRHAATYNPLTTQEHAQQGTGIEMQRTSSNDSITSTSDDGEE